MSTIVKLAEEAGLIGMASGGVTLPGTSAYSD